MLLISRGNIYRGKFGYPSLLAGTQLVKTCTILTTTPNAVTSVVHDRMPVILDPADYDVWLDPGLKDAAIVSELLKPFDSNSMRYYPVSNRVTNVQNDDAECARPVAPEVPPQQLFS